MHLVEFEPTVSAGERPQTYTLHRAATGTGKGKAIPVEAWTDPEGSRRLRLPDFETIGT